MVRLEVMTSSLCSGKCIICPYPDSYYAKNFSQMSIEMFTDIIKKYPKIDVLSMYLFNDPFLEPRLFELMDIARKTSDVKLFSLSTNLSFIPENIERLKEFPHELWVSFHGANKETYEKIMGLNYENAMKNIIKLNSMGFKFRIRGAGISRTGKTEFFSEGEFFNHFNGIGISQELEYFSFHDRAGIS